MHRLVAQNSVLSDLVFLRKGRGLFLSMWFIMASSLSLSGSIRGLLPFSGLMFAVFRWKSISSHCSFVSSPILTPFLARFLLR